MADPAYIVDGVLTDSEAWVGIQTTNLAVDTASVTFTSGTGTQNWSQYLDLVLVIAARGTSASFIDARLNFNNDTGTNYLAQYLMCGTNNSPSVLAGGSQSFAYARAGMLLRNTYSWMHGSFVVELADINSGKYKSAISMHGACGYSDGYAGMFASTWKSQAAITQIDFSPLSGSLAAGGTISLFGILPRMVS